MSWKSPVASVAAAAFSVIVPLVAVGQTPTTVPADPYAIPHVPVERIEFRGAGYPIIPDDVQVLIDQRQAAWDRMAADAFARAMPEVERWEKLGRPFVRVARQPADLPRGDVPAFPGAEGGGMYALGGRGGKVFVVTSLADSGPGTLREACEAGGPRIVVFGVAGIIRLERPLDILAPYLTIAGQTAPGDGVCVAGHATHVRTHDVVVRHLRFRRGSTDISNRDDSLSGDAIGNVIVDHVSASWGNDETLSIYRQMYAADPTQPRKREKLPTVNNTIQWTIVSESLDTYHHGFGATWGGLNAAFHHNLFACNTGRNPSISSRDFTFANNVLFNWRHRTLDGGARTVNVINNTFKPGPKTEGELRRRIGKPEGGAWYAAGNVVVGDDAVTADNWAGGIQYEGGRPSTRSSRLERPGPMPHLTIESAEASYEAVLAGAGATLPWRDAVDERVARMVRTGEVTYAEGKGIITDVAQVGGYPEYRGEPVRYRHNDGMPDWWKAKHKLDPDDPGLAAKDADGDGYTNVEEYLNGTDPTERVDYKDLKNNVDPLRGPDAATLLRGGEAAKPSPWSDAASDKKATDWAASLELGDAAREARVRGVIATHLRAVRDWDDAHPDKATLPPLPQAARDALTDGLRAELTEPQVEAVLDKYTVGKVAFTLNGYRAIVPDLTAAEEATILGHLREARAEAVHHKTMSQISAVFEVYKTKCEQHLNANGRDWRALYKAYTDAAKARKQAAATTRAAD